MAVTSTNTFTVTRDDIIKASLRALGALGVGETPITEDYTNCSQALNIMIKSWSKKGIPLWVTQEISFPVITDISVYPLGVAGGYLHTNSFTITNGGTGGVDGSYTLGITDATGTGAVGSFVVSGGTITSITITTAGSGYTAPSLTYSTSGITGATISISPVGKYVSRPLVVLEGFIRDTNNLDVPLTQVSRQEFKNLGNKTQGGTPNLFYFDAQIETAYLSLYNVPEALGDTIYIQTKRQFYDMTSGTDNFDFPQAWFQALKWGLAAELCTEYAVDIQMISYYEQKAAQTLQECFDESVEETSVYFTVREW